MKKRGEILFFLWKKLGALEKIPIFAAPYCDSLTR